MPRAKVYEARAQRNDAQAIALLTGGPECPPVFTWLWECYEDLLKGITIAGLGIAHLTWQDLDAWTRRRRLQLTHYEVDVLFDLSNVKAQGPESHD